MNLEQARAEFPVVERYAYLNHASSGPLPKRTAEAMAGLATKRSQAGNQAFAGGLEETIKDDARKVFTHLINARWPEEITLTRNTSHGLNIVAASLTWREGDNVICAEGEFPANVYPWMNLKRKGVEVRMVKPEDGRLPIDRIAEAIDSRTKLIALSFVEFASGFRNDLELLASLARERGVLLSIDAIQGLGVFPVDVQDIPIDFLSAGTAKWLLGPIGFGFLYIRRERMPLLDRTISGWRGVVDWADFFRYDSPFREDALRYEEGSLSPLLMLGATKSVQLLMEFGIANIASRVLDLTRHLIDGLESKGLEVISPHATESERSGIVSFVPQGDPEEVTHRLTEAGVIVSQRGDFIRVSPHFYNTEEEVDRLLNVV
jgi:cysteine desulfurase/selenocysteine lyase